MLIDLAMRVDSEESDHRAAENGSTKRCRQSWQAVFAKRFRHATL